jgi:hypothetical protein
VNLGSNVAIWLETSLTVHPLIRPGASRIVWVRQVGGNGGATVDLGSEGGGLRGGEDSTCHKLASKLSEHVAANAGRRQFLMRANSMVLAGCGGAMDTISSGDAGPDISSGSETSRGGDSSSVNGSGGGSASGSGGESSGGGSGSGARCSGSSSSGGASSPERGSSGRGASRASSASRKWTLLGHPVTLQCGPIWFISETCVPPTLTSRIFEAGRRTSPMLRCS